MWGSTYLPRLSAAATRSAGCHDGPVTTDLTAALTRAAIDTEQHVARAGWDQPRRLFALVRTATLAEREPSLAGRLADGSAEGFTAVEQDGMAPTAHLESLLGRMAWPQEVDGVALAVERIVVPPEAERDLPADPEQATEALLEHPERQDVRLLVAVLRTGESICLLRQRAHDSDDMVATGDALAPGLVHALRATLEA